GGTCSPRTPTIASEPSMRPMLCASDDDAVNRAAARTYQRGLRMLPPPGFGPAFRIGRPDQFHIWRPDPHQTGSQGGGGWIPLARSPPAVIASRAAAIF